MIYSVLSQPHSIKICSNLAAWKVSSKIIGHWATTRQQYFPEVRSDSKFGSYRAWGAASLQSSPDWFVVVPHSLQRHRRRSSVHLYRRKTNRLETWSGWSFKLWDRQSRSRTSCFTLPFLKSPQMSLNRYKYGQSPALTQYLSNNTQLPRGDSHHYCRCHMF